MLFGTHSSLNAIVVAIALLGSVAPAQRARQSRKPQQPAPARPAPRIEVVEIPAGEFMMGSDVEPDERPPHRVVIPHAFAIGKYEVTQAQWTAVMGSNPSQFTGANLPVERVTWAEAQAFVTRLSAMTGKTYRLPTEAEWEYACRAGEAGHFSYGNSEKALARYGWFDANAREQTHAVGEREPNAWGAYDMHGNVWEWCSDWYAEDYYASSAATNPTGPATGTHRTLRGGSYGSIASGCRSANRFYFTPEDRYLASGLRIVLELKK